ncbi:hypothetical protein KFK09_025342 [Dendrobium nobile]|uniref:Uncharacterized protein n=1 Tax=Dendrobium nobile TaxID=94219 RepID=A0A8T3AHF9_DENNO|nr:hypothetical protein KFK09_025342 [Dendrobium nobile]
MADPKVDHGFAYNSQGKIDILQSLFFDPDWEIEDTVDNYVDRILFHLVETIDEQRPSGQLQIVGHSPASPPFTFPWIKTVGVLSLLVASFGLLKFSFR